MSDSTDTSNTTLALQRVELGSAEVISAYTGSRVPVTTRVRSWSVRWGLPLAFCGSTILHMGYWFGYAALGEIVGCVIVLGAGGMILLNHLSSKGGKALGEGQLASAARECALEVEAGHGLSRAIALNNLARIAMRMGAVRDALALFQEVEGLRLSSLDSGARCGVAACHALLGDMNAAQLPTKITNSNSRLTQYAFSAIVWARSGDWEKLQKLGLPWDWKIGRTEYEKHEGRVLHLLKAFAQDSAGQVCQENLTQAKPSFVDEYRYLTQDWPKLREFVAAQNELSMPLPVAVLKPSDTSAD